ncbi:MAG: energy transducer TonB [Nitrospira sp.]|nr:energy transducer TonB [Nitrospira sp.]
MTSNDHSRLFLPAWGISLILHGAVVGLALLFVAQIKPVPQGETFQWDVALVDGARPDSLSEQAQSAVESSVPPAKQRPPSRTKPVQELAQPVMPTEQTVEPPYPGGQQVYPIERTVEVPQFHDEPLEQVAESAAESTVEPHEGEPVPDSPTPESIESQPIEQESVAVASAPDVAVFQEAPDPAETHTSHMDAASVSVPESQASGLEMKADNRWLAETLWRRVAELKRYPSTSRMNGEEGKVILKAVIRSDGRLATVTVQKSSGFSALDEAAMEAVRLACPLHMKYTMGKPQIVVSLPIVYRLAN